LVVGGGGVSWWLILRLNVIEFGLGLTEIVWLL